MKSQVSGGVMAAIVAVVIIVIGVIAWRLFAPQHGTMPTQGELQKFQHSGGPGAGGGAGGGAAASGYSSAAMQRMMRGHAGGAGSPGH